MRYTQEPAPEETPAITATPTVEPRAALRQRPAIACFRCTGNGLYSASGLSLEDIPPGETKNGEIEMLRESLSTTDEQIDEYFDAQVTLTVSYQDTIGKSYLSTSEDNTKIRLAQNSTEGSGGVESHSQK